MTASFRPVSAARRPTLALVWACLVALAVLLGIGSGQAATTGRVAVDPSEFVASVADGDSVGSAHERTDVPIARVAGAAGAASVPPGGAEALAFGCRDRGATFPKRMDAFVCDMPVPLADPFEQEPIASVHGAGAAAWLRAGRRAVPPDPPGRATAPLLRPPTA
ncbi:MAG: hypothetical protein EHM87_15220 [Burkholderiales bacterium]|nr:MAG: hypothetical protein EHM87_15220 [Burkholderiales bacterium]